MRNQIILKSSARNWSKNIGNTGFNPRFIIAHSVSLQTQQKLSHTRHRGYFRAFYLWILEMKDERKSSRTEVEYFTR